MTRPFNKTCFCIALLVTGLLASAMNVQAQRANKAIGKMTKEVTYDPNTEEWDSADAPEGTKVVPVKGFLGTRYRIVKDEDSEVWGKQGKQGRGKKRK